MAGIGGAMPGAGRKPGSANKKTREIADKAAEKGITPLEFMLMVMRGEVIDGHTPTFEQRCDMAKASARFMHPTLQSVEHSGKDGGPIETKDVSDLELGRRLAYVLEKAMREAVKNESAPGA
jgi:hypothetical protein